MSTLKGSQTRPPVWAQAILDDSEHSIAEGLASSGYPPQRLRVLGTEELIVRDPKAFMRAWLSAYRNHPRYTLKNDDLWNLTRTLAILAVCVLQTDNEFVIRGRVWHETVTKPWDALLDAGLCTVLREVLDSGDIFDEFSSWLLDMMKVMEAVILCLRSNGTYKHEKPHLYNAVEHLCTALWKCCSSRQDVFGDGSPLKRLVPDLATRLRVSLRDMLQFYVLHRRDILSVVSEEYLSSRELYLMCWFYRDEPWRGRIDGLLFIPFTAIRSQPDQLATFIQREIIEKYGGDSYLARLGKAIQSLDVRDPEWGSLQYGFMGLQREILVHDGFSPYFHSTGFVPTLCTVLRKEPNRTNWTADQVQWDMIVLQCALDIVTHVTKVAPEGITALIREHNILQLVSRTILTLSNHMDDSRLQAILRLCEAYENVGKGLFARSAKNPLRKDYGRSLRREWYPLLKALDQNIVQHDTGPGQQTLARIRRAWCRVGTVGIRLDEELERKEYEKRAAKLCSWKECQWHTVEPSEPPKACTGCGETRYCGKSCQTHDWKNGHKQMCRRLKQAPHNQT
ncbi:hypothetical protein PENSPDRAFT_691830 [Peniophora sp. CONT]|nr:hypothetical protein PENSPDRAFT_691830 [Peniophora sp. CONT]